MTNVVKSRPTDQKKKPCVCLLLDVFVSLCCGELLLIVVVLFMKNVAKSSAVKLDEG